MAAIAQLGERQTEDLKVPGSILGLGMCTCLHFVIRQTGSCDHTLVHAAALVKHDTVSERLRRWTRNPLGSARRGSHPLGVAPFWPSLLWWQDHLVNHQSGCT